LLKSSFLGIAQAKAEVKNFNLAGGENLERARDRLAEIDPLVLLCGIHSYWIREEIAEGTVIPFRTDSKIEGDGTGRNFT
jgi:hypothetical protein